MALLYALRAEPDEPLPEDIWILDSLPGIFERTARVNDTSSVNSVLKVLLEETPDAFESREWVINFLESKGISRPVALWLGTNVVDNIQKTSAKNAHTWAFDKGIVNDVFEDFCRVDLIPELRKYKGIYFSCHISLSFCLQVLSPSRNIFSTLAPFFLHIFLHLTVHVDTLRCRLVNLSIYFYIGKARIHFLRAGRNDLWTPEVVSTLDEISRQSGSIDGYDIRLMNYLSQPQCITLCHNFDLSLAYTNPRIQLHTMPNVGHWLHTENWPGVLDIVDRESGCFL